MFKLWKKLVLGACVIFVILIIVFKTLISHHKINDCAEEVDAIEQAIHDAKECQSDDDCVDIALGCPFGCGEVINRDQVARIKKRVSAYNEQCEECDYLCSASGENKAPYCHLGSCSF